MRWLRPGLRRVHRRVVFPLLDFVLPSSCWVCAAPLGAVHLLGACAGCACGFELLAGPRCVRCALPRPEPTDLVGPSSRSSRCARCVLRPPPWDAALAVAPYAGLGRSLVLRAKLGQRPELFHVAGRLLARAIAVEAFAAETTIVVAVPSPPTATLRRGFGAAREVARVVARSSGLPLASPWRLLRRPLGGGRGMSAAARRRAVARAFSVSGSLAGARVLLVDDVMTSGATAAACTRALRRAGAVEVRCAVWARTLPRS